MLNRTMLRWIRVVIVSSAVVALSLGLSLARAEESHSRLVVVPPWSVVDGRTYGDWTARWWQWGFGVPKDQNLQNPDPTADPDCAAGQTGNVWFLSGEIGFGPGTLIGQRSCTIHRGVFVFYPLVNCEWDNVGYGGPPTKYTVSQLRAFCDPNGTTNPINTSTLFATVDGVAVTNLSIYRAVSPVFSYTVPPYPNNIQSLFGAVIPGSSWPTTTVSPAIADGYYLMLAPLAPGPHTLTFGGGDPSVFREEMTYTITVR
jgi:hypothetical protein